MINTNDTMTTTYLLERARRLPWRDFSDSLTPDEYRECTFFGTGAYAFWRDAQAGGTP